MIRNLENSDISLLQTFCKDFDLPNTSSPLIVVNGVAIDKEGRVLGYGQVKLTSEVFLIVDPSASRIQKVDAIQELFIVGKEMSRKRGLDSWLSFTKFSNSFDRMIQKRFGFKKIDEKCFSLDLR